MAIRNVQYFKDKFKTGYTITEEDYADWLDSFRSVLVGVPLSDTTGLETILAAYRKTADKVPVADIEGLSTFVSQLTANFLTTASEIQQDQVAGLVEALAGIITAEDVQQLVADGLADVTPSVGENGNWWVNGVDTGVKAAGKDGDPGGTYSIGENGNWIDPLGADTGIGAVGVTVAYDSEIAGIRDGKNNTFSAPDEFLPGSLSVWDQGVRLTKGNNADFVESDNNRDAIINRIITSDSTLIFEYKKAISA